MNSEQLIRQSSAVIKYFAEKYHTVCYLYIKDGWVFAGPVKNVPVNHPFCLILTRWYQENGLSNDQWSNVGSALFDLYIKEQACQTPPKRYPLTSVTSY